ncbi:B12-binding domain-containing radical SAM protein [bacterium]|nr:B12-binding domain-containing radical SAM protein [Nanoarchaeota archaeon]MBU1627328.1 B12-binding domain-containing radical SAM protein [bacterium]
MVKQMNVLLVNPVVINQNSHPPLGLLYIASALMEKGVDVSLYDPETSDISSLGEQISNRNIDVIGVYSTCSQHNEIVRLVSFIKGRHNDIPIIIGGPHASSNPQDVIKDSLVDMVVQGEGELLFPELVNLFKTGYKSKPTSLKFGNFVSDKVVQAKKITDLDSLPIPARDLADMLRYTSKGINRIRGMEITGTSIIATRACPYTCSFCGSDAVFGNKVIYRDPKNVVDEMRMLKQEYGVEGLFFLDDTLTVNKRYLAKFLGELIEADLDISWALQSRVENIDENIVRLLKKSGCVQIEFGIESGSERILRLMNKRQSISDVYQAFEALRESGIRTFGNFMFDYPTETREDIDKTLDLILGVQPDVYGLWQSTPYPGTALYNFAKRAGLLTFSKNQLYDFFDKMWTERIEDFRGYFKSSPEIFEYTKERINSLGLQERMYQGNWTILNQGKKNAK